MPGKVSLTLDEKGSLMTANVQLNPDDWPSAEVWRTASRREQDSDVVFLPENNRDLEVGVYGGEITELVQELQASGVNASFSHDPEAQRRRERKGHGEISIIMSAGPTAPWEAIRQVLSRLFSSDQLQVFIKSRSPDGVQNKVRMRGRGNDVAEAMSQLSESFDHSPSDRSPS